MQHATPAAAHHAAAVDEVLASVEANDEGLSSAEASRRLEVHGPNRLPEPAKRSALLRLLSHFHNILIYVLMAAALFTALLGHWIDTGVILAVVVVNAIIGYIQEGRAEQAMDAIRKMLAPHTSVLRDGRRQSIDSADVVPGDIVLLEAGERVPADLRLFAASGLRVEEAVLTGESVPVEKSTEPVATDAPLGDRSGMAFSGTLVAAGTGRGVAVGTGAATEIGRISGMLSNVEQLTTPLLRQMNRFATLLTILILVIAGVLLAYGYFVGHMPFVELFMAVVGLSVAAVPVGLPAVLTITLAVGVQAMARRNAIVRRLPAIETLGSVSVICTDKTGTLTRNEMMVASVDAAGKVFSVAGEGYAPEGAISQAPEGAISQAPEGAISQNGADIDPAGESVLREIAQAAAFCNDAVLRHDADGWHVAGDPMEGALKAFAGKIVPDAASGDAAGERLDEIPFDAEHRYMAVLQRDGEGDIRIFAKGAPERLLGMCREQRRADGGTEPLRADHWHRQVELIAAEGQRVLALAVRPASREKTSLDPSDLEDGLVLIGLVGLIDPPRPEAITAVAECREAGIRVKMITGDHAGTARAIGRAIGLENTDQVLTGADLEVMDDGELRAAAVSTDIFARTSPEHKLRLVRALQAHGLTVAMTGDGVNDAPALKSANAGVAMGRKGSEAAKEASELVLADDNFASIAAAVREGRTVYDNIKKVITWTLPTNAGESLTIIVAIFFAMAMPVTPVQILWVNLITAVTLGLALAFEPTEAGTMHRPPRPRGQPLLGGELVWHIVLVSGLFLAGVFGIYSYAVDAGYSVALAQTMALNTLVVLEIFHLFFVRNIYGTSLTWQAVRGTRVVWATVIIITAAQFAVTYVPLLQHILGTQAVPLADGLLIVTVGVVFFAMIELEKQLRLAIGRMRNGSAEED